MRVITGSARGRKIETLDGMDVRPTSDRVKEGLFSIIQFDLPGAVVLDLFAGSGQLGIEALSRGAALCVFVDGAKKPHEMVKQNLQSTGLMKQSRVVLMDAQAFVAGTKDTFDVAFVDPPYHKELIPPVLAVLAPKMRESGIIICEHEYNEELPENVENFRVHKQYKYGKIRLTVYRHESTFA